MCRSSWVTLTPLSKLAWHSDSDDDDVRGANTATSSKFDRVVVLKGMFRPEDLEKEPELLLDLKEDVREEAESLGTVTNVVLFDVSFARAFELTTRRRMMAS